MKISLFVVAATLLLSPYRPACAAESRDAAITPLGEFSNMRIRGEHCSGYSLQLWRSKVGLYGLIMVCNGLVGDTPTGVLESLSWNRDSGSLSWKARLTLGSDVLDSGEQVPSRDAFVFSGRLTASTITGKLVKKDTADPDADTTTTTLVLNKRPGDMQGFPDYAAWRHAADVILQLRGPRW